jgi:hypothetical protein
MQDHDLQRRAEQALVAITLSTATLIVSVVCLLTFRAAFIGGRRLPVSYLMSLALDRVTATSVPFYCALSATMGDRAIRLEGPAVAAGAVSVAPEVP